MENKNRRKKPDWKESSWIHILIVSVTITILRLTYLEISIHFVTFTH